MKGLTKAAPSLPSSEEEEEEAEPELELALED